MSKKDNTFRFIVGSLNGPHSADWKVWTQGNSAYACWRSLGEVSEVSFHENGISRFARTKEFSQRLKLSSNGAQRCFHEWKRALTPVAGSGKACLALAIGFPTNQLSTTLKKNVTRVSCIDPAPTDMITGVEVIFTRDSECDFKAALGSSGRRFHKWLSLTGGESVAVVSRHGLWNGTELFIPASHGENRNLICSDQDPHQTGRP